MLHKRSRQVFCPFFFSSCFLLLIFTGRLKPPPVMMEQYKNRKQVINHCRAIVITNRTQCTDILDP